jgi:hypothetical protein
LHTTLVVLSEVTSQVCVGIMIGMSTPWVQFFRNETGNYCAA